MPATPQAAPSTPAQPPTPQPASNTTASTAQNPPATPTPAQTQQVPTQPGFGDASAMLVGNRSESAIREMEAMGFERPDIERALRAAYYNPDRAIDYLLNGIPESIQAEQRQAQQQREQQQLQGSGAAAAAATGQTPTQPAAATTPGAAQPAAALEPEQPGEVNLFEAAAQAGQRGGAARGAGAQGLGAAGLGAGAGAGAGAGGAGQAGEAVNIDFLRNSQHFQQLRRLVQQQPAMLEPILQQVAEGNPQLAQLIGQNPETFLQLLSEDLTGEGGGEGGLGTHQINVTQEEAEAIDRLCGLGFPRQRVIQAYFACDKNEELAANFLFEQPDDDE